MAAPSPDKVPELVKQLVAAAVDPAVAVDLELRVLHFNRAYASLAGMREGEMRKQALQALCHERLQLETCREGRCVALRAAELRRHVRMADVRSGLDDRIFIVTAAPLLGEDGAPFAVLEVYRDVTDENRMQENYRALLGRERRQNEILQEEVRRRTAELSASLEELKATRMHLVHSEKMSALGLLVAGIAHELNNPINYVNGNIGFLVEHVNKLLAMLDAVQALDLDPETKAIIKRRTAELEIDFVRSDIVSLVDALRKGVERLTATVRGLLAFSRSGGGEFRESDLNAAIASTLDLAQGQAKGRIEIQRELGDVPHVPCDISQISQVVMNLVVNAIQAIDGHGSVFVRTRTGPTRETAIVEVEDTGSGIAHELQGKIFDPFFTTKDVGKGTGLGLSISYGIVKAHGGSLNVESEPGKGTKFTMTLLVAPPSQRADRDPLSTITFAKRPRV